MTLTATQVKAITKPARFGDGAGLYLVVRKTGSRNWMLRSMVADRRTDIGLGGYPTVSLAKAREKAREYKTQVADGNDPTVKTPQRTIPTFEQATLATHKASLPKWRSEEHADGWIRTLRCYVFPVIGDRPVDQITRADVLDILAPLWGTKQETARRLRQRIRTVFKWAIAYEYVDSNPAGELLDGTLPAIKINKTHWRAMPYAELPDALKIIQNTYASIASKLSFQFLTLTAARSGEVRGAIWDEIDWDHSLWTIPARRMKGGLNTVCHYPSLLWLS